MRYLLGTILLVSIAVFSYSSWRLSRDAERDSVFLSIHPFQGYAGEPEGGPAGDPLGDPSVTGPEPDDSPMVLKLDFPRELSKNQDGRFLVTFEKSPLADVIAGKAPLGNFPTAITSYGMGDLVLRISLDATEVSSQPKDVRLRPIPGMRQMFVVKPLQEGRRIIKVNLALLGPGDKILYEDWQEARIFVGPETIFGFIPEPFVQGAQKISGILGLPALVLLSAGAIRDLYKKRAEKKENEKPIIIVP